MVTIMTESTRITLTIFTPAYNRATLLPRLFDSISTQVPPGSEIEWLVIDDGSSDKTPYVLAELAKRRPDLVRFVRVANGGKHRAINRAAQLARGTWIMIVDSDDMLADAAINSIVDHISKADSDNRIGLLRGLKRFPELAVNHRFQVTSNPCTHADWLAVQPGFDTAEVIRTTALAQNPFPDFEGERFMAEGWLWHRLAAKWLTFFVNQQWVICEYLDGGLSERSAHNRSRSPRSAMAVYEQMLSANLPITHKTRASVNWWRYRWHAGRLAVGTPPPPFWRMLFAIPGWLAYLKDRVLLK